MNPNFQIPADGWFQIAALGEYPVTIKNRSGEPVELLQVVDGEAVRRMANRFLQDAAAPGFPGVLVDQDHFSLDEERASEAYGWITELANRNADGLWGRIRLTDLGEAALRNGRYRFISPVWHPRDLERLGQNRVRPLRLDSAGLTNVPNMKGMAPLSNRENFRWETDEVPAVNHRNQNQTKAAPSMKTIALALGLAAEAGEESILAETNKLKNRASTAEAALEPLKNRVTSLETENQTLLASQVEQDLERLKNRYVPEKRDAIKAQLLANRANTLAILEAMPEPTSHATPAAPLRPLTNRATAGTPDGMLTESDRALKLRNRATELRRGTTLTWDQAWTQASAEIK